MSQRTTAFTLVAGLFLAFGAASCITINNHGTMARQESFSCYWMTQDGARWVSFRGVTTKDECRMLDSCSGGEGQSGGGCYKWAASATAPAQKW